MKKLILSGLIAISVGLYYINISSSSQTSTSESVAAEKVGQSNIEIADIKIINLTEKSLASVNNELQFKTSKESNTNIDVVKTSNTNHKSISNAYRENIAKARYMQQQQNQISRMLRDKAMVEQYQKRAKQQIQRQLQVQKYQKQMAFATINREKMSQHRSMEDVRKIKMLNERNRYQTNMSNTSL